MGFSQSISSIQPKKDLKGKLIALIVHAFSRQGNWPSPWLLLSKVLHLLITGISPGTPGPGSGTLRGIHCSLRAGNIKWEGRAGEVWQRLSSSPAQPLAANHSCHGFCQPHGILPTGLSLTLVRTGGLQRGEQHGNAKTICSQAAPLPHSPVTPHMHIRQARNSFSILPRSPHTAVTLLRGPAPSQTISSAAAQLPTTVGSAGVTIPIAKTLPVFPKEERKSLDSVPSTNSPRYDQPCLWDPLHGKHCHPKPATGKAAETRAPSPNSASNPKTGAEGIAQALCPSCHALCPAMSPLRGGTRAWEVGRGHPGASLLRCRSDRQDTGQAGSLTAALPSPGRCAGVPGFAN